MENKFYSRTHAQAHVHSHSAGRRRSSSALLDASERLAKRKMSERREEKKFRSKTKRRKKNSRARARGERDSRKRQKSECSAALEKRNARDTMSRAMRKPIKTENAIVRHCKCKCIARARDSMCVFFICTTAERPTEEKRNEVRKKVRRIAERSVRSETASAETKEKNQIEKNKRVTKVYVNMGRRCVSELITLLFAFLFRRDFVSLIGRSLPNPVCSNNKDTQT